VKLIGLSLIAAAVIAVGVLMRLSLVKKQRALQELISALTLLEIHMATLYKPLRDALAALSPQSRILRRVHEVWLDDDPLPAFLSVVEEIGLDKDEAYVVEELITSLTQARGGLENCFSAALQLLQVQLTKAQQKLEKDGPLYVRLSIIAAALVFVIGL
jgi:hypothetical protein